MHAAQPGVAAALQADRLPDPGDGAIALLAAQRILRIAIEGSDDEGVAFSPAPVRREIELKRGVAALMVTEPDPIQPGIAGPVHRAEDEERPPAAPIDRRLQLARVPAGALELLADAGERRRPGEGDPDALREAVPAGEKPPLIPAPPLRVEVKGPITAEIEPWLSLEVGTGVRG